MTNAQNNPVAWLEAVNGERTPVRGSCFLGRATSCEVVLPEAKVSRQHALVQTQKETEFWLIDLGSANGTYLNGQRVRHPCRLADGDSISIAGFTFGFHCRGMSVVESEPTTDATFQEIRNQLCWLLVADMQGSTVLLRQMPAEEGARVTGRWLADCRRIVEQQRGTINKFLGDGFLAYWLAGATSVKLVAQAVLALKQLQDNASPPFRMVLHYGRVSLSGVASLGEEGLSGTEVNFAFRMEKLAGSLGVPRLLSDPAHKELEHVLAGVAEGRHAIAGFQGDFAFFSF